MIDEAGTTEIQRGQLEQTVAEKGADVERLTAEIERISGESLAHAENATQLEQVTSERGAEIERLNGEVSRLIDEAGTTEIQRGQLEQVAGERGAEIKRLEGELSEKSEVLDRYIQESAQMARMIVEEQIEKEAWKKTIVETEIDEVIRAGAHETSEHQHINLIFRGVRHLEKKITQLDIRIVEHRGKPGFVIFKNEKNDNALVSFVKNGEEKNREYMLIILSDKKIRNGLIQFQKKN